MGEGHFSFGPEARYALFFDKAREETVRTFCGRFAVGATFEPDIAQPADPQDSHSIYLAVGGCKQVVPAQVSLFYRYDSLRMTYGVHKQKNETPKTRETLNISGAEFGFFLQGGPNLFLSESVPGSPPLEFGFELAGGLVIRPIPNIFLRIGGGASVDFRFQRPELNLFAVNFEYRL